MGFDLLKIENLQKWFQLKWIQLFPEILCKFQHNSSAFSFLLSTASEKTRLLFFPFAIFPATGELFSHSLKNFYFSESVEFMCHWHSQWKFVRGVPRFPVRRESIFLQGTWHPSIPVSLAALAFPVSTSFVGQSALISTRPSWNAKRVARGAPGVAAEWWVAQSKLLLLVYNCVKDGGCEGGRQSFASAEF